LNTVTPANVSLTGTTTTLEGARVKNTFLRLAMAGLTATGVAGCGSDGGGSSGGACKTPEIMGTLLDASGTASVKGVGTLPDGIADGLQVEILVNSGEGSFGVLPPNLLDITNDVVCGKTVKYAITSLSAGTYTLGFDIYDPNDNSDSTTPLLEGTATSAFTIADGQMLTVDAIFQTTPK
jgi:hypothetical protein